MPNDSFSTLDYVVSSTGAFLDNVNEEDLEKLAMAWDNTSMVKIA